MSFLSKRWRHLWVSTPFLYFEDFSASIFDRKVRNGVWQAGAELFRRVHDWLNFVVECKPKELDLNLKNYVLPECILNASSLTILKLIDMDLFVPSLSTFPSLKFLSLVCVKSDAKSLQNLISGCPIIEELYLSGSDIGHLDFAVSKTLRSLSLLFVDLTSQWLDSLFSRLPLLERLFFSSYKLLNNTRICSHSLKYVFLEYYFPNEAALTTPNLVGLRIVCQSWSKISVEAPNLLEVNLTLFDQGPTKDSYIDRVHLLSNLNSWKMVLTIYKDEVLIFPKRVRQKYPSPMPNLKHLKVMRFNGTSFTKIGEMRDSLLWCAPSLESLEIGRDGT
ncbi:putative F-box/LRR-repeat protein At5g02700 [Ziziphus jujuba]|uniref:F-box/LRR-repeat protein At5g02700 n=2 Tax=Ziziphus jujuba TaxID=326968 RepID=A0ABM4A3L5_ZIZJJ|nr:putative F-box/LRR-repeat protein At5g02700 [Ziziphus jujuba]